MNILQHLKITNPSATITGAQFNSLIDQIGNSFNITGSAQVAAHPASGTQSHLMATKLTSQYNNVTVVGSGAGVKLPDALMGYAVTVKNSGVNNLNVYPYETGAIDNQGLNVPAVLVPGEIRIFNAMSNLEWDSSSINGRVGATGSVGFVGATGPAGNAGATGSSAGAGSTSSHSFGTASAYVLLTGGTLTISNQQLIIPTGNVGETTLVNPDSMTLMSGSNNGPSASSTAVSAANSLYNTLSVLAAGTASTWGAQNMETVSVGYGVGIFLPGIYRATSGITTAASQTITLIGDGDYIFISDAATTFGATTNIVLKHGAHSSRIFWVSAGAITTGATNTLKGNFITPAGITLGATNDIEGRILSTITAAITVDGLSSNIYLPA